VEYGEFAFWVKELCVGFVGFVSNRSNLIIH